MKDTKNENQDTKTIYNETIYQLNTKEIFNDSLPREDDMNRKKENILQENLIFEYKPVSLWKFYCHINEKCDWFLIILAIIFTIVAGISNALEASIVGDVLNILQEIETDRIKYLDDNLYQATIDEVEPQINKNIRKFVIFGSLLFTLNVLSLFFWFYVSLRQMHKLRIKYFALLLHQEQGWFDQINVYEFSSKIQSQIESISAGLGDNPRNIFFFMASAIAGYFVAFNNSWKITLILSACSLPFIIVGHILNRYGLEEDNINALRVQERTGGIAEEIICNIKTVASFANFDYEINRFNDAFKSQGSKKVINMSMVFGLVLFGVNLGIAVGSIYVRKLIDNQSLTAGKVTKVILSLYGAFIAMFWLFPFFIYLRNSCISSSDYFYLYERIPEIHISEENLKPDRESIKGNIEFKNVKFYYPSDKSKKFILNGINLNIPAGKKVALVGESGSGKSTTLTLIERLYEPVEGEILLDGINIRKYNLEYLRNLIGSVKQDHFLINRSIRHNIIFGREELVKGFGNEEELIKKASDDALIKDFIEKKTDKYEYIVGVNGNKLLPTHKQRISIARALFGQPKIIIFDEATSHLDNDLELGIVNAMNMINKKNITILVICYSLNILKNVDLIYTIKDGKVVEFGSHEELMAKNGYYAGLIKSEFNHETSIDYIEKKRLMIQKFRFLGKSMRNKAGYQSLSDIKFQRCKMFELISNNKCDLFIGIIGALIYGAGYSSSNFILGKLKTSFTLPDISAMKKEVLKWALILIAVSLVWCIFYYVQDYKLGGLGSIVVSKTRKSLFQKYLELHMGFFDLESNSPSNLLSTLTVDTASLKLYFTSILSSVFVITGLMIFALTIGFYYSWRLTLILLVFFPFRILFSFYSGNFKYEGRRKYKEIKIEERNHISECIINIKTIISYNYQQSAINAYRDILEKETNEYIKDCFLLSLFTGLIDFLPYAANSIAYKCGMQFLRHKKITFERLIQVKSTCMAYIDEIYFRIRGFWEYSRVNLAFKSVFRILNTKPEINAFEYANENKRKVENLKGKIEFKDVTFSYPTNPNKIILNNLSFVIQPTQRVAIIGNTESGKSSIIQLIDRFYEIYKGSILIDDIDIKDYNLYELRKKIGYMSQEPVLFRRNIYENILYGKLNASKEEIFDVANKASINKYLQEKIDLDEYSTTSEGEKQRISLARIFLKNPDILLLDNVTSSLDLNNEKEILKSVTQMEIGKTIIILTQKLSNIIDFDNIIFMEKGKIIEQGTHKELMNIKGKYYQLYKSSVK